MKRYRLATLVVVLLTAAMLIAAPARGQDKIDNDGISRLLYVAAPDAAGGKPHTPGLYVFDIDDGYKLVKHIPIEGMGGARGCCGGLNPGRLFISHSNLTLVCFDLVTEKKVWEVTYGNKMGGAERACVTPDGKKVYVPGGYYSGYRGVKVVDGTTGKLLKVIDIGVGKLHNMAMDPTGKRAYVGPIASGTMFVIDTETDTVVQRIGPFSRNWQDTAEIKKFRDGQNLPGRVSPFTFNGSQTLCFVNSFNVGFLVGDLVTGRVLHSVEVPDMKGFSHGVGMTPDETELWVPAKKQLWIFDATVMPPKLKQSIKLSSGSHGWMTFSLDGKHAWPDNGQLFDLKTKELVATLQDDQGRRLDSSKMIEVHFKDGKPIRMGDQFGIGRRKTPPVFNAAEIDK